MVVNSAMDTKSLSRVEHVERIEGWKKVERFMAGGPATEMPRQGVRPCGLAPGAEKTTVVIYCGNQVWPCCSTTNKEEMLCIGLLSLQRRYGRH